jgi:C1A family cysteine protease
MLDFLKPKKGFGARLDTRPTLDKEKDFLFEEIVASADPVNWVEKKLAEIRSFPIFDQNGSGSCVAQTMAKLLGILYWLKNNVYVHFSATHIYQRRANKPDGGMAGDDCFKIAQKGVTLEALVPSQVLTDSQMDNAKIEEYKAQVGEIFKIGNWVNVKTKDIDTIASIIQKTGKGVMVWFFFNNSEWTTTPVIKYPNLDLYASSTARHSVTAVDFTILGKSNCSDKTLWGKKALIIDDSWGSKYGAKGQRFITEEFFKARNWYCAYPLQFKFDEGAVDTTKPKYTFTKDLQFTANVSYGDKDIIALQNILKYEGLFPSNTESTGYFGAITRTAVIEYQKKYGIAPASGFVGEITRASLNSKYSV